MSTETLIYVHLRVRTHMCTYATVCPKGQRTTFRGQRIIPESVVCCADPTFELRASDKYLYQ